MVRQDHKHLTDYNFRLIVDNIELMKPIDLRNDERGFITHRLKFSKKVYGNNVFRFTSSTVHARSTGDIKCSIS
jgi:hypothetical protein